MIHEGARSFSLMFCKIFFAGLNSLQGKLVTLQANSEQIREYYRYQHLTFKVDY